MSTLYSRRINHFADWANCRSKPSSPIRGDLALAGLYTAWSRPGQDFVLGPNHLVIDWHGPDRVPHRLSAEVSDGTISLEVVNRAGATLVPLTTWDLENPRCLAEINDLLALHGPGRS